MLKCPLVLKIHDATIERISKRKKYEQTTFQAIDSNLYSIVHKLCLKLVNYEGVKVDTTFKWDAKRISALTSVRMTIPNICLRELENGEYTEIVSVDQKPVIIGYQGELYTNTQSIVRLVSKIKGERIVLANSDGHTIETDQVPLEFYVLIGFDFSTGGLSSKTLLRYLQAVKNINQDSASYVWLLEVRKFALQFLNSPPEEFLSHVLNHTWHSMKVVDPNHEFITKYQPFSFPAKYPAHNKIIYQSLKHKKFYV
jgi:hypothetical protein